MLTTNFTRLVSSQSREIYFQKWFQSQSHAIWRPWLWPGRRSGSCQASPAARKPLGGREVGRRPHQPMKKTLKQMKKGGSPVRIMNRAEVQAMWKARKVSLTKLLAVLAP